MNKAAPPLIISLKPKYADLVFRGLKTAELRRRVSGGLRDRDVYVYVSSPVMELRGGFRVGQVWSGPPEEIWSTVSTLAGVSREVFDDYYLGAERAFALEIVDVWEYAIPRSLEELRSQFPNFGVPQSYRFAKRKEVQSFRQLKKASPSPLRRALAARS